MNDIDIFQGGALPSYLKNMGADDVTNALAGEAGGGMRRISIKGGVFREMIGGKEYRVSEERAMNIIIIKAAPSLSRTYYSGTYTEGEAVRPTCWSSDSRQPDEAVKNKQSNTCMTCPQNIKGSGQGDSRACRFSQRLAVVIEGEVDREEVYQLTLPATSIFGEKVGNKMPLRAYAELLKSKDAPMSGVVTEMRFDTSSPTPKLIFRPIRVVTEDEYEVIQRLKESDEAKKAIELTVSQADNVKKEAAAPSPAPKKIAPPPKVVEPEPEEEEEIEEPKKAAPKKAAAPAAEPSALADLVGQWDDD